MTAAKTKTHPLNGMHTAGIFSDMSVDGPEIGTLVVIVDRAKNLPNRKTIGKQDPYVAARLGKEAKKSATDVRGGQTPRWDQELRFTVHDSSDYYQLKVSVFNDDKKTELIGETWIDLRDVVVPGGGQNDLWHNLSCRGKYSGEIRIEITYYDTRPKPEKPSAKPKPVSSNSNTAPENERPAVRGGREMPKRRPLPSDPVTGQAPPAPVPDPVQTPPRPQPNPTASHIPNQSPLQNIEYNTPPPNRHQQHHPSAQPGGAYGTSDQRPDAAPLQPRSEVYPAHGDDFQPSPGYPPQPFERQDPRQLYHASPDPFELPAIEDVRRPAPDDDRPPPPPAHRTRTNSGNSLDIVYRNSMDLSPQKGTPPMRHDVLRQEAHRMSISSAYPGRPSYRPSESAPVVPNGAHGGDPHHPSPPRHNSYSNGDARQPSPPRQSSYEAGYDPHHRYMQPTVEDVPETPSPLTTRSHRSSSNQLPQYEDDGYGHVPSPAPLNLSGRGSAGSGQYNNQALAMAPTSYSTPGGNSSHYQQPHRNELEDTQALVPANYSNYGIQPVPTSLVPGMDPVLAQEIAERINEERRQERRYTQSMAPQAMAMQSMAPQSMAMQSMAPQSMAPQSMAPQSMSMAMVPRGRARPELPAPAGMDLPPQPYSAPPTYEYDGQMMAYSGGPSPNVVKPRPVSPNPQPQHTIKRKSVSPAPPPSEERRLSGVPFGPDSYNSLNPNASPPKDPSNTEYAEVNGKIITHDGKEVDPSDHLPMDTWAPEPEPRQKKETSPDARSRPALAGAQPMPPSGRRQLRVAVRPQSMGGPTATYIQPESLPNTPPSTGRNRLQKKAHRSSVTAALPPSGSSPLAPISHQDNFTAPRAMTRASTFDYPNENHAPMYGSSPGHNGHMVRASISGPPPIPAKIPIMSGALASGHDGAGGSGDEWALMQEMSRIDLGTGRARRHGRGGY